MIIYGTRATKLAVHQLFFVSCPSCGEKTSTEMYIFGKYFHVFWIPFFPLKKIGVSQCEKCKTVFEDKKMNPELREEFVALKRSTKTPVWNFTGLGLVAALIVVGSISSSNDHKKSLGYISKPEQGDKYYYHTDTKNYSIEKVVAVSDDSIEVEYNMKEFTTQAVEKIDVPQNYEGYTEKFSRKDIKQQFDNETIYKVIR